jgi:CRISPR-associated endonuclease Cas2
LETKCGDRHTFISNIMKRKINLTDIFLLIACGIVDLYQEIKDPLNLFENYYQSISGQTPPRWKKDHLLKTFKYCLRKKYLKEESNFSQGKFLITKKGKEKIQKRQPIFFKKKQDEKIRLVIFDIKEINRNTRERLRRFLKYLGFIMIQKSVWFTRFDHLKFINQWLKENKIAEKVILIETSLKNIKGNLKIFQNKL